MNNQAPSATGRGVNRRNQFIILGAAALILNALFNHFASNDSQFNKTLKAGDLFPSFQAVDRSGAPVSDKSSEGKATLYFFYANWCPCSHESIPWAKKALDEYAPSGFTVVAVGVQDTESRLDQFARLHNLTFPVIINEGGEALASASGVKVTPTSIFVDAGGVVRAIHVGKIETWDQMRAGLEALFASSSGGQGDVADKGRP